MGYLEKLNDSELPHELSFKRINGDEGSLPLVQQMQHVVNHATLHRGQIVGMIRQLGFTPPATDLLFYLMARGLPRPQAERLIVRGFFEDVLARVELEPVREALAEALEARIPQG